MLAAPASRLRLILSLLILGVLAYLFWTGSRYPALNEKAMMSGAIQLEDPLSFEAKYQLTEAMGRLERIFYSTLNWIHTNKKGMTFGILFAAALMTVLSTLQKRSFSNRFANATLGLVIGAPLGVCANCVAPIGKGMYASGMRAETTLAAMVASPTLNIVVLSMLFSLLPFYMAVTKILLSLFVILLAVPILCRFLPQVEAPQVEVLAPHSTAQTPWSAAELGAGLPESLISAVLGVAFTYVKNLWYIIRLTVPMMLLAGFLGATVATLLPQELITGLGFGIAALALLTLVALFLPVPMGFDVVLCGALIATGLAHGYVMAALFTLGSFSVYSFMIISQTLGLRAAALMAATLASLGFAAGLGADAYHSWQSQRALEQLLRQAPEATPSGSLFFGAAQAATLPPAEAARITVTATPFAPPSPAGDTLFQRSEARSIGIDKPVEFTMRDMWPPFWEGRSLSSADFDRDGDIDLAVASSEVGLYLYENDGQGQFQRQEVALGPLADLPIFNAVLADIDNDGWPDLFLASYLGGNYWLRNVQGRFGSEAPRPIRPATTGPQPPLAMALSFADLDRDGYLDVALGNWAAGWYRRIPGEESRNQVLLNPDGTLSGAAAIDLPGIPGETLSILFSDFDDDGDSDLIVGNDFDIPDYFYRGDGRGGLTMVTEPEGLIPHTTTTTMAVKTADLFNSGRSQIYLAQIAGRSSGVSERLKMQPLGKYCDAIQDPEAKATCETNMAIKRWYKSGNSFDPTYAGRCQQMQGRYQAECKAMLIKDLAIQKRDPTLCTLIAKDQWVPRAYCEWHFKPSRTPKPEEITLTHPQILRSNVLLEWQGERFADTAAAHQLDVGGWSWDTKVADFDQDGWQDLYIVNGTWVPNEVSPSNLFFHNGGDGRFTEASGTFGLEDYLMTAAATRFDMDGDGDLDLVTHPVNGPLAVFRNTSQGRGLAVVLEDEIGNRAGIGARLTLQMADGSLQRRELQLGGGFMSFDAPRAHFGLGDASEAAGLQIDWPDGQRTAITGPLAAGQLYHIHRQPTP